MQSELHRNVVHQGVELLLLVSMIFLPAIPKSLLILKEFLYSSLYTFCIFKGLYLHQINTRAEYPDVTNVTSVTVATKWQRLGMFNTQEQQTSHSLQHCMNWITLGAQIFTLQVHMRVLVCDLSP